jgi:alkylation response protein AidB-like acyl-CoA dehydrogenase
MIEDDDGAFREAARMWVRRTVLPALAGVNQDAVLTSEEWRQFDTAIVRGGFGAELPRREDGTADWGAFGALLEEVASVSTSVAMHLVNRLAVPEFVSPLLSPWQSEHLSHLFNGRAVFAGGFTESQAGSNSAAMRTVARRDGDQWTIDGRKMWISGASHADVLVVSCQTDEPGLSRGHALFLIEKERGWKATDIPMLGLNMHPTCEVLLDSVVVPDQNRLDSSSGGALPALQRILAMARCMMATMSVGIAQGAYTAALDYSLQREQFGRPIAGFQLVQEMLVQMATSVECGRLLTRRALDKLVPGAPAPRLESSMAKMYCTEMCVTVASLAVQVHGAIGLAREAGIERMLRDARMMTIPDGTTEIQKLIVGREITGIDALSR